MFAQLLIGNTLIFSLILATSSLLLYRTACTLADQANAESNFFQTEFASFLAVFVPVVIMVGFGFYYYYTKKIMQPLNQLRHRLLAMKDGYYNELPPIKGFSEMEDLQMDIDQLQQRLKKNEEIRNQMLANLSHDLRTPLSNINGYLEGLSDGVIKGTPDLYEALGNESRRLTVMAEQIQQMSQWEETETESRTNRTYADIQNVLNDSASLYLHKDQHEDFPLHIETEPCILFIQVDDIQQAVINLLENAYQYYLPPEPVSLKGTKQGDRYIITVSSPGPALSEKERGWIFERFYRADHSRNKKTGGSGLGLSIVKSIVEHHHGQVWLDSNQLMHSFIIDLPISNHQ